MGLSALEVHELTVAEFMETTEAAGARAEREREQRAWMLQWLLAPHCKPGRVPSVDEILGRGRERLQDWDAVDRVIDGEAAAADQRRAEIEAMRAARGAAPLETGT